MSKSLQTLAKISKAEVEKLQKQLAELLKQEDFINAQILQHQQAIVTEAEIATNNPEIGRSFAAFLNATKKKIEVLQRQLKTLEQKITTMRENLRLAFSEQKKFEIVLENKQQRKLAEEKRKETIILDDIGANIFNRKDV